MEKWQHSGGMLPNGSGVSGPELKQTAEPSALAGMPNWALARRQAPEWVSIGATAFIVRILLFGVMEVPARPFVDGRKIKGYKMSGVDREFAESELYEGCQSGIYRELAKQEVEANLAAGYYLSAIFVDWRQGKGRLITDFHEVSKHWDKVPLVMETLPGFCSEIQRGDRLISFDLQGGYRAVRLHRNMEKYFMFTCGKRFYTCCTLPFGWSHSPMWFTKVMSPVVKHLRVVIGCRVLPYLDDFLLIAGNGLKPASSGDALALSSQVSGLLLTLGLVRHPSKGVWGAGATRLEHLGVVLDTITMRFFITPAKLEDLHSMASKMLHQARSGGFSVSSSLLQKFLGKAISNLVPVPLARFYCRSLYDDLSSTVSSQGPRGRRRSGKTRLSQVSLQDLKTWATLTAGDGRLLYAEEASWCLHTDAADVGFGATLGRDMTPGSPGLHEAQALWSPFRRLQSITTRELVAVRKALETKAFTAQLQSPLPTRTCQLQLLIHIDNLAVVRILSNMVSASPVLMQELRLLHQLLVKMKIQIRANWLPSAMNRHADRLSRTWNAHDVMARTSVLTSLATSLRLQRVRRAWPLQEAPAARSKTIKAQFQEFWGDGLSRLWNPPPSWIHATLHKIWHEHAQGVIIVPHWPKQPWFGRLIRDCTEMVVVPPQGSTTSALFTSERNPHWGLVVAAIGGPHLPALSRESKPRRQILEEALQASGLRLTP